MYLTVENNGSDSNLTFGTGTIFWTGGKASIQVEYLPRTLGEVEGTMIIQTSVGGFLIQLYGIGIESPYEVRCNDLRNLRNNLRAGKRV